MNYILIECYDYQIDLATNNLTDNGLIINLDSRINKQFVEKIDASIGYSIQKDLNNEFQKVSPIFQKSAFAY